MGAVLVMEALIGKRSWSWVSESGRFEKVFEGRGFGRFESCWKVEGQKICSRLEQGSSSVEVGSCSEEAVSEEVWSRSYRRGPGEIKRTGTAWSVGASGQRLIGHGLDLVGSKHRSWENRTTEERRSVMLQSKIGRDGALPAPPSGPTGGSYSQELDGRDVLPGRCEGVCAGTTEAW